MFKKAFLSLTFAFLILFYAEAKAELHETESYDQIVSLGYSCQVAFQLEHNGVRTLAHPFDWFHTPIESLLKFIANEGKNFFDLDKIYVMGAYPGDPARLQVYDTVYGIISYHDFLSFPHLSNYAEIKAKYDKRIKRFFNLLQSNQRVLFVRQDVSKEQAEYLDEVLHSTYPNLSYTLIAINNTEEYKTPWNSPRIENFYMESIGDWRGNFLRWQDILSQFKINRPSARPTEEIW